MGSVHNATRCQSGELLMFNTEKIAEIEKALKKLEGRLEGVEKLLIAVCEADSVVQFVPCEQMSKEIKKKMN